MVPRAPGGRTIFTSTSLVYSYLGNEISQLVFCNMNTLRDNVWIYCKREGFNRRASEIGWVEARERTKEVGRDRCYESRKPALLTKVREVRADRE